jgi:hypothetical protein
VADDFVQRRAHALRKTSMSSVVIPGRTNSPASRRMSAASVPASRILSITSGDLTCGSFHLRTSPVSAYEGRAM